MDRGELYRRRPAIATRTPCCRPHGLAIRWPGKSSCQRSGRHRQDGAGLQHRPAGPERGARSLVAVASHASRQDPLDLLRRPLASADLSPEQARTVDQLLNRHDGSTVTVGGRASTTREPTPKVRKDLADFLLRLANTAPLMIGVDDVDFAHETSLQFLLYLSRRVNRAPNLLVLTSRPAGARSTRASGPRCAPCRTDETLRRAPWTPTR